MWRYLGCLLRMGLHPEPLRASCWSDTHRLGRWISKQRFEQLYRYFTIQDGSVYPRNTGEGFWWQLEPALRFARLASKIGS
jgi:hypothetical protein